MYIDIVDRWIPHFLPIYFIYWDKNKQNIHHQHERNQIIITNPLDAISHFEKVHHAERLLFQYHAHLPTTTCT